MPSKQVTDRQKSATQVIAATDTHAPLIADALARQLTPHLRAGEQLPDLLLLVRLFGRLLQASSARIAAADLAHEAEQRDDDAPRTSRDQASEALRQYLLSLRGAVTGIYGAPVAAALGLLGETPSDPVMIKDLAQQVGDALGRVRLPQPLIEGAAIDPQATARRLGGMRAELERHIDEVALEARQLQQTQSNKQKALDEHDVHFSGVAGVLASALYLAGERELSERLRPSRRRPGRTTGEDGEEGSGGGGNGGTGAGTA